MIIEINEKQAEWLLQVVKFRIEDEEKELSDIPNNEMNKLLRAKCEERVEIWEQIKTAIENGK